MHNAIHIIKHVIVDSDNKMESYHVPFQYPQGPVSKWAENLPVIPDNGPFILPCKEWLVISAFWNQMPHMGEVS